MTTREINFEIKQKTEEFLNEYFKGSKIKYIDKEKCSVDSLGSAIFENEEIAKLAIAIKNVMPENSDNKKVFDVLGVVLKLCDVDSGWTMK